jgi:hypothetical protein
MKDFMPVILALVTGLPATLAALASLIVAIRNSKKADSLQKTADENKVTVEQVHQIVNGQSHIREDQNYAQGRADAISGQEKAK